jgi:hypothetical protein
VDSFARQLLTRVRVHRVSISSSFPIFHALKSENGYSKQYKQKKINNNLVSIADNDDIITRITIKKKRRESQEEQSIRT